MRSEGSWDHSNEGTATASADRTLRALIDAHLPGASLRRLWDRLRSMFWVVPAASVAIAVGLAAGLVVLDHLLGRLHDAFLYPGPPGGARTLLSSIITAMITFTGMVFSVSIVVLQLTNGQFSSRVVRIYLRDLTVQATLGIFLASFTYAMVVQRAVRGTSGDGAFVPRIAVTVSLVLVVASVIMFIRYISHISNMVRVATIVTVIAGEARDLLEHRYPSDRRKCSEQLERARNGEDQGDGRLGRPVQTIAAPRPGVLVSLNEGRLVDLAQQDDYVIEIVPRVGDFVPLGAPLCVIRCARSEDAHSEGNLSIDQEIGQIIKAISLDTERTMEQDLAFGFRQLVDISERALSPAMNDPTTASQCIDVMHDLLRRLAGRPFPDGVLRDDQGAARVVVPQYTYGDFLEITLAEIWRYGSDSPQVPERISWMLADLEGVTRDEDLEAVRKWQRIVRRSLPEPVATTSTDPQSRVSKA